MDYPNNSERAREQRAREQAESKPRETTKPVAKGEMRREGAMGKLLDIFVKKSIGDAVHDAVEDRLLPMIVDGIFDTIQDSLGMMFYGDRYVPPRRGPRSRNGRRRRDDDDYYDYSTDSRRDRSARRHQKDIDDAKDTYREAMRYSQIDYETEDEALDVLDALWNRYEHSKYITVLDLYELSGIDTKNYALDNWGWTSLASVRAIRLRNGRWRVSLPTPLAIDRNTIY